MKNILFLATGGTLSCRQSENGLAPALTGEQLLQYLPEIADLCTVTVENPYAMDSTDITTAHRIQLAELIYTQYTNYDGFIVSHGTDTLSYTASLLYHMLCNIDKPVVLTGAQKPIGVPESDAERNLLDAFRVAVSEYFGVAAVVHGQIIRGNHLVKVDCKDMNPFRSINAPLDGTVNADGTLTLLPQVQPAQAFELVPVTNTSIFVLKLIPDLDINIFSMLSCYQHVILESYGSGGIPVYLEDGLKQLIEQGTGVYITTQCLSGTVDLTKYTVGCRAHKLGAISLGNHTLEDAIAAIQCGEF